MLKEKKRKVSIIVDESETESKKSTMNIYFKENFAGNKNYKV